MLREDPEVKRRRDLAYRSARREELAAKQRAYHAAHRAERREANRLYLERRPDVREACSFANGSARRKRKYGSEGSFTARELLRTVPKSVCGYCAAPADVWDHMTPLCRGGRNDLANIIPCCNPCNRSKQLRTAREFVGLDPVYCVRGHCKGYFPRVASRDCRECERVSKTARRRERIANGLPRDHAVVQELSRKRVAA